MGGEWQEMTLADISSDVAYGYTESATDQKVGPHFLRITDIQNGIVNWANVPYCQISAENRQKYRLQKGDIVVARTGNSTGENYLYQGDEDAVFASYLIRFRVDHTKADPRFVWYNLRSRNWWNFINNSKTGSAQAGANAQILGRFPLSLPRLDEQRAIAHILGTLDDKIELNRRINETLEAMARALFRSWFLDFDPVRAKAEGRDPGLPKHIAELFPDSFEDSELGEIPRGWKTGTLGEISENPRRNVQPDEVNPTTPYIALEHMPRRCIALSDWAAAEGLESNKFRFKKGEILFGKLRPYFHKVGVAPVDGVCSTDIVVVLPKAKEWFGFLLGHVSSEAFVEYTNAGSTGTKMPRTNWNDMARYAVVIPPEDIAKAFTTQIRPAVNRIITSIPQSHTLAALRDALLPKLISGELRTKMEKVA